MSRDETDLTNLILRRMDAGDEAEQIVADLVRKQGMARNLAILCVLKADDGRLGRHRRAQLRAMEAAERRSLSSSGRPIVLCTKCSTEIREDARFCTSCGAPTGVPQRSQGAYSPDYSYRSEGMTSEQFWRLFWRIGVPIIVLIVIISAVPIYNAILEATYPYCDDPDVRLMERCIER